MRAKDQLGRYGEDLAAEHLVSSGLVVLERNWRCRIGEIDIVALEGRTLVVCEVKTRRGLAFGSPLEAVTERKLRRLRALAAQWVHDHDMRPGAIRVDVIGVLAQPGAPVRVEHLRGVIG